MTPDAQAAALLERESLGKTHVERRVELLNPDRQANATIVALDDLIDDARSVVLLGDPGMGKTTALRDVEGVLPGSIFKPVRIVAPSTTGHVPAGGTLLLDALDEAVAAGAQDPLGTIAGRLQDIGRPRFWLSCRAVDWVGQGGAALLQECARSGLVVARLLPLDDCQITELARSRGLAGADLLDAMREVGLVSLLRNPLTLNLIFEVAGEGLPQSRYDLFSRAAELLTRERHDRPGGGRAVPTEVLDVAGAVCAVLLISGANAFTTRVGDSATPSMDAFDSIAPSAAVEAARRTRLFTAAGEDMWEPQHRTLAEFLGARFLTDRIWNHGLSLQRVLALLRGTAPAPHPSLRGLFAWLVTLAPPDRAEQLVRLDPYGVLSYGDPTRIAPAARRALLAALGELVEREPWFRMQGWGGAQFGALAIPELIPELRQVLTERPVRPHLLSCACDALAEGEPRPELVEDLATFLTDTLLPAEVRAFAVRAYIRASSAAPEAACALFRRLLAEPGLDPQFHLASRLLLRLYPERLGTADLVVFLDRWVESDDHDGLHVEVHLRHRIPAGVEMELLDALATRPWATREDAPPLSRVVAAQKIIGLLAARAIHSLPTGDALRLVAWFGLLRTYPVKEREEFREALAACGDLLAPLVIAMSEDLDSTTVAQAPFAVLSRLEQALLQWRWPPGTAARLLSAARSETCPSRSARLFAAALDAYMRSAHLDNDWFEEAWSFGHDRSGLRPILDAVCVCGLDQNIVTIQQQHREQARHLRAAKEAQSAQIAHNLEQRTPGIRDGTDLPCLGWLAMRWFNLALVPDDVSALSPPERLRAAVPESIATAAELGFRALASNGSVPAPAELANSHNSIPGWHYAVIAGADLLFDDAGPSLPQLPPDRLTALLCLALARVTDVDAQGRRPWIGRIVFALPVESTRAVLALVGPELTARDTDCVSGLAMICEDEAFAPVRRALVPALLHLARRPYAFWRLVNAALRTFSQDEVHGFALERLSGLRDARPAERWPWLHLAWRLDAGRHEAEIRDALAGDNSLHLGLAEGTGETLAGESLIPKELTLAHRALILRVFGPLYAPVPPPGGFVPPGYQLNRVVQAQIDRLSTTPDEAAGALLAEVAADPAFGIHREHALQALAVWRREAEARAWEASTVGAVVAALQGGPPASAADLVAFTEEHLRDLNTTLRRTEDNQWRGFWNTDASGHTNAKVENFCRDQLVILLRGRFERAGLGLATEVRHVGEDRCDIVARTLDDRRVPIEVKCDYHPRLWTAWRDQLAERYAREPKAAGTGIYLVFWFGPERGEGRDMKSALDGSKPGSAAELESKLSAMVEESGLPIRVVVLDVMPPKPRRGDASKRQRRPARAKRGAHRGGAS